LQHVTEFSDFRTRDKTRENSGVTTQRNETERANKKPTGQRQSTTLIFIYDVM